MSKKKKFKVYGIYDTETCNIGDGNESRAYPILFIYNDVSNIDVKDYQFDSECDNISFYRNSKDFIKQIDKVIKQANNKQVVPIICAYNLMFDLQPLLYSLSKKYKIQCNAQTATSVYTLDLMLGDDIVLRFWDTFYLEMNGLRAMGETCGLPKAVGDWDYDVIRTQDTPITERELHYAKRDVQVIPAYLSYLVHANAWLTSDMLGNVVLTKTSLVRRFAKTDIGKLTYEKDNKKGYITLLNSMERLCLQEFPTCFNQYAIRKAAFRGGLTFTCANNANRVWHNVVSLDVTSMHHTFINGRYIPVHFGLSNPIALQRVCTNIVNTTLEEVLENYHKPFDSAIHALIRFTNLRLKKDTIFERAGIGIIPESKFTLAVPLIDINDDVRAKTADENIRERGFRDYAKTPIFAFGKLMEAEIAELFLNEIELWNIAQVYDFDMMQVQYGELSMKYVVPPDYVTLQSNILFEQKTDMKTVLKHYTEGKPYPNEIPNSIPSGIADELRSGEADVSFLNAYYNSTIKGMFNGIYGTQAMDLLKPQFMVINGEIKINNETVCTPENFDDKKPKKPMVLYTYGMRIVAGSRMHLVIALKLLGDKLGNRFNPTGGDTDSIKASVAENVTDAELKRALEPLENASDMAIAKTMQRIRKNYPQLVSQLHDVGHFDIESATNGDRWEYHFEAWNKARMSMSGGVFHVTCAGLSRPRGLYHIETWAHDMYRAGYDFEAIARAIFGYDTFVEHDICHSLEHYRPLVTDRIHRKITDYRGETAMVDEYQSIALYPSGRWLGETTKRAPLENVKWLQRQGQYVDMGDKIISRKDDRIYLYTTGPMGMEPTMIGHIE